MPNFELKPLDGGSLVHLPEGETVLGRGPLFGVNDKRVSRNHGVLENADGKLRIKPTHVNPCFIQASLEASPQPLKKDQWHTLNPGEMFSLLPGKHIYQVVAVEERGAEEEIEGTLSNSQNLEESDGEVVVPEEANTSWSAPPSANDKPDRSTLPDRGGPSVCQQSTLVASLEGKSLLLPPSSPARDQPPDGEVSERLDGEMSVPARRIRTLPSWMVAASSGDVKSPSTPKGAGKRGPAKAATTPKPKPKPASQVAAAAAAAAAAAPAASRATPQWARTRVLSSGEEEEVLEEKEEVVQSAKRWRKRTKSADDDEEEEEEPEGSSTPRPVRRAKRVAPAQDRVSEESDTMETGIEEEEEDEEEEEEEEEVKQRVRAPGTTSSRVLSSDEEGAVHPKRNKPSSQNGHKTSKVTNKVKSRDNAAGCSGGNATRRTPCPYGSSCYRKNPIHFRESSHPGDSDFEEEAEEEVDEDDDRPECPFGTDCYRKNPLHRQEYKHTKPPAKTSASQDDDDEAYDDSFINDDSEEDLDEDSDYVPDDSGGSGKEDVKRLQREAKAFLRKKK